jgi:hypothetical protein
MTLFYPSKFQFCSWIETLECVFQNFSSSNSKNTFQIFYSRQKKFKKCVSKFFNKDKKWIKETWGGNRNFPWSMYKKWGRSSLICDTWPSLKGLDLLLSNITTVHTVKKILTIKFIQRIRLHVLYFTPKMCTVLQTRSKALCWDRRPTRREQQSVDDGTKNNVGEAFKTCVDIRKSKKLKNVCWQQRKPRTILLKCLS